MSNGDTVIVDLRDLVHMEVQQNACRRELKTMSEEIGVGIFSLDSEDKILLVPGSDVIVDVRESSTWINPSNLVNIAGNPLNLELPKITHGRWCQAIIIEA